MTVHTNQSRTNTLELHCVIYKEYIHNMYIFYIHWARLSSLFFLPNTFVSPLSVFPLFAEEPLKIKTWRQSLWHMVLGVNSQVLAPLDLHFEVDHHMTSVPSDFTISNLLVWWMIHSQYYPSHHDNFMMKLLWLIWIRYKIVLVSNQLEDRDA